MIFITAKFCVKPEYVDDWLAVARPLTEATRAEPGNLWFDWYRNTEDPTEFVVVEAFRDADAGGAHVRSEHFVAAMERLPQYLVRTPSIVSQHLEQDDWDELGEMRVD